jgi:DNA-binding NarL/FixJ family response regulator
MILLISEDKDVSNKWEQALDKQHTVQVVNHLADLPGQVESNKPEMVFYYLDDEGSTSIQKIFDLREKLPESKFVVFSVQPNDEQAMELMHAGIQGYSPVNIPDANIEKIAASILEDEIWVGRKLMQRLIIELAVKAKTHKQKSSSPLLEQLTDREREIALQVAKGENNKQIAKSLDIAERTVKAHLSSIFQKTEVNDRLKLALLMHDLI